MATLNQWHEENHDRLKEEKHLMKVNAAGFKYEIDQNGNSTWIGEVDFVIECGGKTTKPTCDYNPLLIKIICPADYPKSFPRVYDVKKILATHNCIHIYPDDKGRICYGTRLDNGLDFEKEKRIKDLVPIIGAFLYGQWEAEHYGGKWKDDRLHGQLAFVHYELFHGSIPSYNPCPCGENRLYIYCCLKKVEEYIKFFSLRFQPSLIELNLDTPCPCGSGVKFKGCHHILKTYDGRKFYLQSLPVLMNQETFVMLLSKKSKEMEKPG